MSTPLDTMRCGKDGKSFKSEADAVRSIRQQALDEKVFGPVQHDGAWFIEAYVDTLKRLHHREEEAARNAAALLRQDEDYRWVVFPERTNPVNEPEFVEISWNGESLTIKRNVKVCLPRRYLNVCDEAKQKVFRPLSNPKIGERPYVDNGYVARRPYTDLGPAERDDYIRMLREGNEITNREIAALSSQGAD